MGYTFSIGAQTPSSRFDGIMMDYEYFTPLYGAATPTTQYADAEPGFHKWLDFADALNLAKGTNGIGYLQAYLANIVFMLNGTVTNNYFNYNNADGLSSTSIEDSKLALWDINSKHFDKLALAFFVDDQTDYATSPNMPNPDPTTFLSGFAKDGTGGHGLPADGAKTTEQL